MKIYSHRSLTYHILGIVVGMALMGLLTMAAHADEPTTIKRIRGKAGIAERIESRGKAAKENSVRVRLAATFRDAVVQERTVVKGSDVFDGKPKPERKVVAKEKPQPASVNLLKVKKGKVGK